MYLRLRTLLPTIVLLLAGCTPSAPAPPDEIEKSLTHAGRVRSYLLFVPPGLESAPAASIPLLLGFHGGVFGGAPDAMSSLTDFNTLAHEHGFIVAYPAGVGGNWNDGRPGINPGIDDVGFVRALIDELTTAYPIDPRRIYATGISNGGHLCNRLAIELSDRIAAIAPVCALLSTTLSETSGLAHTVPVLMIVGRDDPVLPYEGGTVGGALLDRGETLSAAETVDFWIRVNNADAAGAISDVPDSDPADETRAQRESHAAVVGSVSAEVILLTVDGGGHTWPGGRQYLPEAIIGRTSRDFSASREVWDFFAAHGNP